jgi:hypothetical protein
VEGIRKAARAVVRWPDSMDDKALRWALFNAHIFISPVGGTGGGAFRTMFSRFLREAAEILGDGRIEESADEFERIGDEWEALGAWFRQASEAPDPASRLGECVAALNGLAEMEERAWGRVRENVTG